MIRADSILAENYPETTVLKDIGAVVPWRFSGYDEEYDAVRQDCGLFDHTVMGRLEVTGDAALDVMTALLARNVEYLLPERSLMSLVLDDDASIVDVITVYLRDDRYLVETSPGKAEDIARRLRALAEPGAVTVTDLAEELVALCLEGPYSWKVIGDLLEVDMTGVPYQGVTTIDHDGAEWLVSRTGYTGEYGYKLYAPPQQASKAWQQLTAAVRPVGYEVLETTMLEVRQPNPRIEAAGGATVLTCGMNWLVDIDKPEFVGRDALVAQREAGTPIRTVGVLGEPGTSFDPGAAVRAGDLEIGELVHTVFSRTLERVLGLARLDERFAASGLDLEARLAGAEEGWATVRTASSPYLIPASWGLDIS